MHTYTKSNIDLILWYHDIIYALNILFCRVLFSKKHERKIYQIDD